MTQQHIATTAVRQGIETDLQHRAVVPPIYLSSNYSFADPQTPGAFDYSRSANPTREQLAIALAEMESGHSGVITASGMAAVHLAVSVLSAEELLLVPHDCYGGSLRLFQHLARKGQFRLQVVDMTDTEALTQALAASPGLIWLETPSNPLLRIVDIAAICQQAKQQGCRVAVDNTFLTPVLQQPLLLGADMVIHSTTKYINGHSDVIGGAVIAKTPELSEELLWNANTLGLSGGALDAYLTLRGLRTLSLRMAQHQHNASLIVAALQAHPVVSHIYYPGLVQHPGHGIAQRQQRGFGGMISFELKGGAASTGRFVAALKLFSLAESLGGVESLVAVPASMTHRAMTPEQRHCAGISDGLIRLSVGIEHSDDLLADIQQALTAVAQGDDAS